MNGGLFSGMLLIVLSLAELSIAHLHDVGFVKYRNSFSPALSRKAERPVSHASAGCGSGHTSRQIAVCRL